MRISYCIKVGVDGILFKRIERVLIRIFFGAAQNTMLQNMRYARIIFGGCIKAERKNAVIVVVVDADDLCAAFMFDDRNIAYAADMLKHCVPPDSVLLRF